MKTSFKNEIRNFEVLGMHTETLRSSQDTKVATLSFSAEAKGRLVDWNNITGHTTMPMARIAAKGFGPKDIGSSDINWVVHIERRGKPVARHMKPTPRKLNIDHALASLLAPALLDADTAPGAAKKVKPKTARTLRRPASPDTRKTRAEHAQSRARMIKTLDMDDGLRGALPEIDVVAGLEAAGLKVMTEVPKVTRTKAALAAASESTDALLAVPEFLKR
jgi:hypothetical protein